MGDLIHNDRLLKKQIEAEGVREVKRLFQATAGFSEPEPVSAEEVEAWLMGLIEK